MSASPIRVLLVDDEVAIRRALRTPLNELGFETAEASRGEEALLLVRAETFHVVLLDIQMPGIGGMKTLVRLRALAPRMPILILTVQDCEEQKVEALECGADDYITKPFSMPELEARLRVALRHAEAQHPERNEERQQLVVGSLVIDLVHHEARRDGRALELTAREFDLLAYLAKNAGKVCTHHLILQHVWGAQYQEETHYLRVYSHRLRRKLGDADGTMLRTHSGIGYQLVAE